jgi:alanyl-tRNA synthetase
LKVEPEGVLDALQKVLDRQRQADKELQRIRGARLQEDAARLAGLAESGVVVHREDGYTPDQLRDLAQAVRRHGARVVVVAGSPDGSKVGVAVASGDPALDAGATAKELAQVVGGGGGGSAELAVAGGSDPSKIDALLAEARRRLGA